MLLKASRILSLSRCSEISEWVTWYESIFVCFLWHLVGFLNLETKTINSGNFSWIIFIISFAQLFLFLQFSCLFFYYFPSLFFLFYFQKCFLQLYLLTHLLGLCFLFLFFNQTFNSHWLIFVLWEFLFLFHGCYIFFSITLKLMTFFPFESLLPPIAFFFFFPCLYLYTISFTLENFLRVPG